MSLIESLKIRTASNQDRAAITELIDGVYQEYGDRVCLEDADSDLLDLEASYAGRGGALVVLEGPGGIVGSHAGLPIDRERGLCTFRRLYLAPKWRGTGAGACLMDWAIDWAKKEDFRRVEFWSDTRFERAHNFFERFGFVKEGSIRDMTDGHDPYSEYLFFLDLDAQKDAQKKDTESV